MKMLGLLRIRNVAPWIRMTLASMSFCDAILVLDGESTDGSREICAEFSNVELVINTPNLKFDEGRDREILALLAQRYNPEWICSPDGDEVFLPDTWDCIRPYLDDPSVKVIEQFNLNLWGSEQTVRWDGNWREQWRQRFWRFIPGKLTYAPFSCAMPDQAPPWPYTQAGKLLHYGNLLATDRKRRQIRNEREQAPCPSLLDDEVELISLEEALRA